MNQDSANTPTGSSLPERKRRRPLGFILLSVCMPLSGYFTASFITPESLYKGDLVSKEFNRHQKGGELSAGPESSYLELQLKPIKTVQTALGDALDIEIKIINQFGVAASFVYAYTLYNDHGNAVIAPYASAPFDLGVSEQKSDTISIPAGLPDGYYRLNANAAGLAAGLEENEEETGLDEEYFMVSSGKVELLDFEQYYLNSAEKTVELITDEIPQISGRVE